MKKQQNNNLWWLIFSSIIILLFLPLLLRSMAGDPVLAGSASALHERHASELRSGMVGEDAMRSVPVVPTPHLALIAFAQILGVSWIVPSLVMIALLCTLAILLSRFTKGHLPLIAVITVAIAPTALLAGTRHAPAALALFFSLCAILSLRKTWLIVVLFALASVTHPFTALFVALFACWMVRSSPSSRATWGVIFSAIGIGALWTIAWRGSFSTSIFSNPQWSFGLYEFGAPAGLSIFILIAALYGAFRTRKQPRNLALVATLTAIGISFPQLALVSTVALAIFAASGIDMLLQERWVLNPLRELLVVLFVCAGVFLVITAMRHIVQEEPDAELVSLLQYVGEQRRPGGILTDPSLAPIVEWYSGRPVTLSEDSSSEFVSTALYNRDSVSVFDLLERTNTSFILLTDEMRTQRFTRSDEGLLFLLPNTERFVKLQSTAEATLWYYISRKASNPTGAGG